MNWKILHVHCWDDQHVLWSKHGTRPGNDEEFANLNMVIEILDLPSYNMVDFSTSQTVNVKTRPGIYDHWIPLVHGYHGFWSSHHSVFSLQQLLSKIRPEMDDRGPLSRIPSRFTQICLTGENIKPPAM
jgi:hypothetical protein